MRIGIGSFAAAYDVMAHYQGGNVDAGLAGLESPAGRMIDDLPCPVPRLVPRRMVCMNRPISSDSNGRADLPAFFGPLVTGE